MLGEVLGARTLMGFDEFGRVCVLDYIVDVQLLGGSKQLLSIFSRYFEEAEYEEVFHDQIIALWEF